MKIYFENMLCDIDIWFIGHNFPENSKEDRYQQEEIEEIYQQLSKKCILYLILHDEIERKLGKRRSNMPKKYRNVEMVIDGITFASKKEANRYQELKLLEADGVISNLKTHPKFVIVPKTDKRRAVTYSADFEYFQGKKVVVEDVKSPITAKNRTYVVKRNLFEFQNPDIDFREV